MITFHFHFEWKIPINKGVALFVPATTNWTLPVSQFPSRSIFRIQQFLEGKKLIEKKLSTWACLAMMTIAHLLAISF